MHGELLVGWDADGFLHIILRELGGIGTVKISFRTGRNVTQRREVDCEVAGSPTVDNANIPGIPKLI